MFPSQPSLFGTLAGPAPLAERMRPRSIEEMSGQAHVIGNGWLARMVRSKKVPSLLLFGPPGCGKTTLARLLAKNVDAELVMISAVSDGIKELRAAIEGAKQRRAMGKSTLLFVDEIHRFNKSQQDALLPHVENGDVIFVGATTENPSFEVNRALLSRCRAVQLQPLPREDVIDVLKRAALDVSRGLAWKEISDEQQEALIAIARFADGDARKALTLLETAEALAQAQQRSLGIDLVAEAAATPMLAHDKDGDQHHQLSSALIKSLRGSDPDAALYWLACLIEGGEDPNFITRRLVIFASEDIGNADPAALAIAMHAAEAVRFIGYPEGRIVLGQAVTALALAPKSNRAYLAINAAIAAVREHGALPVPPHLINASTPLDRQLGHGAGYDYPHDHADGMGRQQYLPDALVNVRFYEPSERGREAELGKRLAAIRDFRSKP